MNTIRAIFLGPSRTCRLALMLAVATAVVAATSGVAFAFWSTGGSGTGSGITGTLAAPTGVTVPATSAGTVAVTWTASGGSPTPTGYYVTRKTGSTLTTVIGCGTPSTPINATSCSDTGVPSGTYTYTVTAVFRSWTATSSPSAAVIVSTQTATKVVFTGQPTTTTGGSAFSVAVTVEDATNNPVPTPGTSVSVAIGTNPSSGTLSGTLTGTTNSSGVATFAGLSIDKLGAGYTLTAASAGLSTATSNTFNITVGTATKLVFTTQPGDSTGGVALTAQPVVKIQDAGGNTVTGNTSQITLSITTPAGATLACTTNPLNALAGVAAFAGCKIDQAGTYTLTAVDGTLTSAQSSSVTITVGAASQFVVTSSTGSPNAGAPFNVTLRAADAGGNTVTTYANGTHTITWSGAATSFGGNAPSYPTPNVVFTSGVSTSVTANLFASGANTLTASATVPTVTGSTTVTVSAGAANKLCITAAGTCTGDSGAVGHGGTFTSHVTVADAFGNPTTSASAVVVSMSVSGILGSVSTTGSMTIVAGTSVTPGTFTLTASGSNNKTTVGTAAATSMTSAIYTLTT
jgi:trimeric autotransporter adhesin